MSRIENRQKPLLEWIRSLPPPQRTPLIWIGSALLAYYIPISLVALTGRWVNSLTDLLGTAVACAILLFQTAAGRLTRRPWLVTIVCGLLALIYFGQLVAKSERLEDWPSWWMNIVVPPVVFVLNTALFLKFDRETK